MKLNYDFEGFNETTYKLIEAAVIPDLEFYLDEEIKNRKKDEHISASYIIEQIIYTSIYAYMQNDDEFQSFTLSEECFEIRRFILWTLIYNKICFCLTFDSSDFTTMFEMCRLYAFIDKEKMSSNIIVLNDNMLLCESQLSWKDIEWV